MEPNTKILNWRTEWVNLRGMTKAERERYWELRNRRQMAAGQGFRLDMPRQTTTPTIDAQRRERLARLGRSPN